MENLKENSLPKEIMDLVSGGSQAEIDELYNFYKAHGAKMGKDTSPVGRLSAVHNCLSNDFELFGHGYASGFQLNQGGNKNCNYYSISHTDKNETTTAVHMNHKAFMAYLAGCYASGRGHYNK